MSGFDPFGFFVSRGWTPEQTAGIIGNIGGESNFDIRAVGDGGRAYGLAQWHPDRQANFRRVFGIDIRQSTAAQQWQFIDWELNNTESRAGRLLRGAGSAAEATEIFMRHYERPANMGSLGRRTGIAQQALAKGKDFLKQGASLLGIEIGADDVLNAVIPGAGSVTNALGITGDCNLFCQFKEWITESGFFQRTALAIFAFILIAAAVTYLGRGEVTNQIGKVLKAKG